MTLEVEYVSTGLMSPLVQGTGLDVKTLTQEVGIFAAESVQSSLLEATRFLIKHPGSHGGRVWRMTPDKLVKTFSWKVWHAGHSSLLQLMFNKENGVNKIEIPDPQHLSPGLSERQWATRSG